MPKILLVDDEPHVLETTTAMLEEEHQVVPAWSGPAAVRLIQEHPDIDLLFTDIVMPGMNGIELAREARKIRPSLRVLFGTGFVEAIGLRPAKLEGPIVRKPYTTDKLRLQVRKALSE